MQLPHPPSYHRPLASTPYSARPQGELQSACSKPRLRTCGALHKMGNEQREHGLGRVLEGEGEAEF